MLFFCLSLTPSSVNMWSYVQMKLRCDVWCVQSISCYQGTGLFCVSFLFLQGLQNWGTSSFLFSSSWVLLFSLSLAFILCPIGCSSLFIYWLFSMEKHPVFQHWQEIRAMSPPITLHCVSSFPVRLLTGFYCTWLSSEFGKSDCGLLFSNPY